MIVKHDRIVLTADLEACGLQASDVGAVVHRYGAGEAFEVEFLLLDDTTAAAATVGADQARPVSHNDIIHARPFVAPAE